MADPDDVLVALVSCGGLVALYDLADAAAAWSTARGRTPPEVNEAALDGASYDVVRNGTDVLVRPAGEAAAGVEAWLAGRPPVLRALVGAAAFFDQAAWANGLAADGDTRRAVFGAARRTFGTRAVRWQPRVRRARAGAPPYLPPQRDPIARLGLVAGLLDRSDAEARAWVAGLLPASRQDWTALDRDALLAAVPSFADLLPESTAQTVAEVLAGDERHGFGWAGLGALHAATPDVFPAAVWDDVRKRFLRWLRRRLAWPLDDAARTALAGAAHDLGVADEFAAAVTSPPQRPDRGRPDDGSTP